MPFRKAGTFRHRKKRIGHPAVEHAKIGGIGHDIEPRSCIERFVERVLEEAQHRTFVSMLLECGYAIGARVGLQHAVHFKQRCRRLLQICVHQANRILRHVEGLRAGRFPCRSCGKIDHNDTFGRCRVGSSCSRCDVPSGCRRSLKPAHSTLPRVAKASSTAPNSSGSDPSSL